MQAVRRLRQAAARRLPVARDRAGKPLPQPGNHRLGSRWRLPVAWPAMAFRLVARIGLIAGVILGLIAPPFAQDLSTADRSAIRDVIQSQVDAFRRDDGASAFGYASPSIQGMFGTPE